MHLDSVAVQRYRSVKSAEIERIGDFNVLIGKNNAGKSTLMNAIRSFFLCLQDGNVVALDPPIGKSPIDFSQRDTSAPIEITLRFSLLTEERQTLLADIAKEAPQLKNATDNLEPSLLLSITIRIVAGPESFAYVRRVALVGDPQQAAPQVDRVLLNVGDVVSRDLAKKHRAMRDLSSRADGLRSFISSLDEDDYRQMRREPPEGRATTRYMLTRRIYGEFPQDLVEATEGLLRASQSFAEFQSGVRALIERFLEEQRTMQLQPLANPVETFSGLQPSVPQFVLSLLRGVGKMDVLYLTEQRKRVGREEAERLLQLKMQRGGDKTLENIKQTVQALLGVKVDAFASPSNAPGSRPAAEMDVDDFLLEVNGSGIREALRLILDVEFQRPKLLLVEEPEIHLHPALETGMMRFLKGISHGCQVFISTHSTNFLDTAEMSNVYLISKMAGATSVEQLTLEDAEAVLPKELGVRLSSLFMFDRLVFVEGPSDEAAIREWAATLGVNLNQANVGFISIGGVRNFAHFATETIFTFLSKRQVQSWFILDRDERDDAEVELLKARLGAKAQVVVLEKREIDNFLLSSHALDRFIRLKQRMSGKKSLLEPDLQSAERAMNECADGLRQQTIDKRVARILCGPVRPKLDWMRVPETPIGDRVTEVLAGMRQQVETTQSKIASVIEQQTQAVSQIWEERKFDLVQGDILLDLVCQKFGTRYKKSNDAGRLAALMEKHQIDFQLKQTIEAIAVVV